jgi:hypothetical protein
MVRMVSELPWWRSLEADARKSGGGTGEQAA